MQTDCCVRVTSIDHSAARWIPADTLLFINSALVCVTLWIYTPPESIHSYSSSTCRSNTDIYICTKCFNSAFYNSSTVHICHCTVNAPNAVIHQPTIHLAVSFIYILYILYAQNYFVCQPTYNSSTYTVYAPKSLHPFYIYIYKPHALKVCGFEGFGM